MRACAANAHSPFPRTQIDGDTRWYLGLNLLFVKTARAIWKDGYLPALVANGLLDCDKLSIDAVRRRGGRALQLWRPPPTRQGKRTTTQE